MSCPDMPEPLCLVENTDTGLVLNESTVRVISQITTPVVVVSVVGPYRTGKSYLLNRLMGRNNGFALGSTIQSKTKGIWVWCRPHPRNPKHTLVLLDTEGLNDVEKGDSNNDNHMFALATLMSSTLVYNNLGTLQNEAIDKLHFVSELTDLIKVKSTTTEESGEEFAKFFPDFVWTVRDFTLEVDQNGRRITPDQYLDMTLTLKPGKSKTISNYNLPRESIRNFFKKLKCFVFDRPVKDASLFKVMETLTDNQLDPGFLTVADEFCNYVFGNSLLKTYQGKSLNGSSIGSLLGMYLETIRSGRILCIESAFDSMAKIENQKAVEAALEVYREVRGSLSFPSKTQDELSALHQRFEKRAVEKFLALAFLSKEGMYQDMLKNKISEEYSKINTENEAASEKICEDILKSLSSELDIRLSNGTYLHPGGYNDYTADKARVVNEYKTKTGRGVRAEQVLEAYLQRREAESQIIMAVDKRMTKYEKETAGIVTVLGMYLETIRSGRIPCMDSAFDSMAKIGNQKAVEAAFEVYRELRGSLSFPTKTQDELSALHQRFEKRAVEKFLSLAFDDKEGMYQDMIKNKISEEYSKINTENEAASEKICEDILKSLSSELDSRLSNGTYLHPGGYNDYTADKARVVNEYKTKTGRGVRAEQVLEAYLQRREAESQIIMAVDKRMTKYEKEMAGAKDG